MSSRSASATTRPRTRSTSADGGFAKRKKYRDVQTSRRVAFVIDDIASVNPWTVRGIEIRGDARALPAGGADLGPGFDPEMIRITPRRIIAWGIDTTMTRANA